LNAPPPNLRNLIDRVLPLDGLSRSRVRRGRALLGALTLEIERAAAAPAGETTAVLEATLSSASAPPRPVEKPEPPAIVEATSTPSATDALVRLTRSSLPIEARARLDRVRRLMRLEEPFAAGALQPHLRDDLIAQLDEAGREVLGASAVRFIPATGPDAIPPGIDPAMGREVLRAPETMLYRPDTESSPRLEAFAGRGVRSIALAALVSSDRAPLGFLEVESVRANPFDLEDLALITLMADSFAGVLERAARIESLVFVDTLTGAYNRSYFDLQVENEMARAAREKSSMALCIADIDDFKSFNSAFGYEAGNQVLKAVAHTLKGAVRPFDTVARWGGEEFAVLLTSPINPEDARTISERLRAMVERQIVGLESLERESHRVAVTVSIGVALFPDHHETAADLWRAANQALLKAKRPPKNQVVFDRPD
jgi:diguanylate cyclase (GGDEF)-like protein